MPLLARLTHVESQLHLSRCLGWSPAEQVNGETGPERGVTPPGHTEEPGPEPPGEDGVAGRMEDPGKQLGLSQSFPQESGAGLGAVDSAMRSTPSPRDEHLETGAPNPTGGSQGLGASLGLELTLKVL